MRRRGRAAETDLRDKCWLFLFEKRQALHMSVKRTLEVVSHGRKDRSAAIVKNTVVDDQVKVI